MSPNSPRFAVVGGGISGLTAAYRLRKLLPEARVELFERESQLGGVLSTHSEGDWLFEHGADSFITKQPWALELCEELGLGAELLATNATDRRALVLHRGELHPVPEGFFMLRPQKLLPMLTTSLLSTAGKARLCLEPFVKTPADLDDPAFDVSLADFATSRLGREPYERLVEPLLAGIFTADANRLSVRATMGEALEFLQRHGSLVGGILRSSNKSDQQNGAAAGARYGSFVTPRHGVGQLVDALKNSLPTETVHTDTAVGQLARTHDGMWSLQLASQDSPMQFDGMVLALPAHASAELLRAVDTELSRDLSSIEYASSAIVCLVYDRRDFARELSGFGFVVPRVEGDPVIACSYSSRKFSGRAPDDQVILRIFYGGALRPELVDLPDAELEKLATDSAQRILRVQGHPAHCRVVRWQRRMPQYHVGHHQRVAQIEQRVAQFPGLELAGNAYHGVGIPYCVGSGNEAARRLANTSR